MIGYFAKTNEVYKLQSFHYKKLINLKGEKLSLKSLSFSLKEDIFDVEILIKEIGD